MTSIARRITASATTTIAGALLALGVAAGANAAPTTEPAAQAVATTSSSAVHAHQGGLEKNTVHKGQSYSARHRYHR